LVDTATLQARLAEAETAYHKLVTGQAARVFVDQNGERIEYVSATRSSLLAYISELKRLLGVGESRGPLSVWL
jgi:predicted TPR repeat methyltransferase